VLEALKGLPVGRGDPVRTALTCATIEKTLAVLLGQVVRSCRKARV